MYINSKDMKIMLDTYKHREFAVVAESYSDDGIRHYKVEFCDENTSWEEEFISIHFHYNDATNIIIIEDEEWDDSWLKQDIF